MLEETMKAQGILFLFLAGIIGILAIGMTIDEEGFSQFVKEINKKGAENGWVDQDGIFHPPVANAPVTSRAEVYFYIVATWVVTFVLAVIGIALLVRPRSSAKSKTGHV
jgi:hypothetical protein